MLTPILKKVQGYTSCVDSAEVNSRKDRRDIFTWPKYWSSLPYPMFLALLLPNVTAVVGLLSNRQSSSGLCRNKLGFSSETLARL